MGNPCLHIREEGEVPVWAWILIILLVVFALGGFGYSRR